MKKLALLFISFLFISCGVQSIPVIPESKTSNTPEINTLITSEIGEKLVSKEIGHKYKAIKVTKGRKPKPGYIITEIKEGDILCFRNAGAYCFSMASNYNSRYKPAEVLWKDGKGILIRERETFEDLLKNQILLD